MFDKSARHSHRRAAIAIIGVSGRYPGGANDLSRLWENLRSGVDAITETRGERWDLGYHHPDPEQGKIYTRCAGLLDQVDHFDADFFGISPREATYVDPQQRLLLELAWEALEDAALVPKRLAGSRTGVFIGISSHDYADLQNYLPRSLASAYTNSGSALSIAANRISYFFDFHGPSVAIDTACSSALVALHQGCLSLWAGESTLALAGAVNVLLQPKPFIGFCRASMLSPTGRCRSFDASADGYVRSEGGGVIALKLLADAERDGDSIRAVIVGSGTNSDGRTNGLSLPNEFAQEALLRQVYGECGVVPEDVFYVEAHGTGTPAGDPIECNALGRVLGIPRRDGTKCLIGSVKSNLGHLEAASGMAGLAKVLLALRHRELPANLHFTTPNPRIALDELNLEVVDRPIALPDRGQPLVMGVSSYGFGGSNAHVVISEYRREASPARSVDDDADRAGGDHILLFSAPTSDALTALGASYVPFLRAADPASLGAICATAALCRSEHAHRLVVAGSSPIEVAERLEQFLAFEPSPKLATARVTTGSKKLAYVFSGNGPQWWGMGRELLETAPRFRAQVEDIDAVFQRLAGWSLVDEMLRPEADARMDRTEIAQPALFALQLGVTSVLEAAGVRPLAVIGHSVGEVAAACVSGALTLEQAVAVIYERSQAQALTAGTGKMAAIGLGSEEAMAAIAGVPGWIEIASINSARAVTVAGAPEAIAALDKQMAKAGVFCRLLTLDYAFHSKAMDVIEGPLREALADLQPASTRIPFVSTVEGRPVDGTELGGDYWWRNIRQPVQFKAAIDHSLTALGVDVFLEIGPHPVLRDYLLQCANDRATAATVVPTLRRPGPAGPEPDLDNLWTAICACHAHGVNDLEAVFERPPEPSVLPRYPWQRLRFWNGVNPFIDVPLYSRRDHPLLGYRIESGVWLWENTLDTTLLPYLEDHVVQGAVVVPATAFIEMALSVGAHVHAKEPCDIEDFEIRKALVIPAGQTPIVQVSFDPEDGSLRIRSRPNAQEPAWTSHVVARLSRTPGGAAAERTSVDALRARMTTTIDKVTHYRTAAALGLSYGPTFQAVESVWAGSSEALGEIGAPPGSTYAVDYWVHPCLLDACLQVLIGLLGHQGAKTRAAYLPVQISRFRTFRSSDEIGFCHVSVKRSNARSVVADLRILGRDGQVVAEIDGLRCLRVDFMRSAALPLYAHAWLGPENREPALGAHRLPLRPSAVAERLAPTIADLVTTFDRTEYYQEIRPRFERLSAAYAAGALDELGAGQAPFSVASLMALGRVDAKHRRYLERLIDIAEAAGLINRTPTGWLVPADRTLPDSVLLWRGLLRDHPAYIAELTLLGRCGSRIAGVLRDEVNALQLIFPENGSGPTEHLYDMAPGFRIYNAIARFAVAELVSERRPDRRFRILEIGGGTGGLAANLLPLLPPEHTDYLFTDVSPSLLGRAAHRFSGYRFVRSRPFDIEHDPFEQGLTPGGFDLIVAADVLHVATDLRRALSHVKDLLAPGGQLLLLENHVNWTVDLFFGQLEGWWRFADEDLRPASALLSPEKWQQVLTEVGFTEPVVLSDAAAVSVGEHPQQSVILAQNGSVVAAPAPQPALDASGRAFLVLVDEATAASPVVAATAALLRDAGARVITAEFGEDFSWEAPDRLIVAPTSVEQFSRLFEELESIAFDCDEVVHLAGMTPIGERSSATLSALQDTRCVSTILMVRALKGLSLPREPRLTLVTSMAMAPPSGLGPCDPGQAPLWGLGRVLGVEHPDLRCRLIDLQSVLDDPQTARILAKELVADDGESEVLLTPAERYVNRLRSTSVAEQGRLAQHRSTAQGRREVAGDPASFRLDFSAHGPLDNLFLSAADRQPPGPGEIELRVHATGLNFRDVMWVMGMLPDDALENGLAGPTIGMECSGEVVRLGPGVTDLAIGDRVLAFAPACFANFVTTSASSVARLPKGLGFEAAATIPTTFLTAYYALVHLARLAPGERVLIHGAAGGVGLAAIQVATRCGAEIFGTAGSPEKRDILGLIGVDHVLDSRSLDFADAVMSITNGQGVDVVLNSLAGEAIDKNFRVLKPFGRFLEIGKRDLYANSKIGLRPFRNNLSYFGIDADMLLIGRGELTGRLLREVLDLFEAGEFRALPYRSFPVSRAVEAFRQMQQSRHIGKIVVTMDDDGLGVLPVIRQHVTVRSDGTYLISGGTSGFGLATARWLAEKGARHFALVSRRGVATDEARTGIAALEAAGAVVRICRADVSDETAVAEMMSGIREGMPPVRGVVHAAMMLDDGMILNLDRERMQSVLAPKVLGAWNLHRATLGQPLDFFVMYSSATTLIGSPGQANYVAANVYLEALAEHRRGQGLAALAVGWGAISEVGYVARNPGTIDLLRSRTGLESLSPDEALAQLDRLLGANGTCVSAARLDWRRVGQALPTDARPRLSLVLGSEAKGETDRSVTDLGTLLEGLSPAERKELVANRIKEHIGRVLGTVAARIDPDRPLTEIGLDSLMTMELGELLKRDMQVGIPIMELIQSGSITIMADRILQSLEGATDRRSRTMTAPEAQQAEASVAPSVPFS